MLLPTKTKISNWFDSSNMCSVRLLGVCFCMLGQPTSLTSTFTRRLFLWQNLTRNDTCDNTSVKFNPGLTVFRASAAAEPGASGPPVGEELRELPVGLTAAETPVQSGDACKEIANYSSSSRDGSEGTDLNHTDSQVMHLLFWIKGLISVQTGLGIQTRFTFALRSSQNKSPESHKHMDSIVTTLAI